MPGASKSPTTIRRTGAAEVLEINGPPCFQPS